MIKKPGIGRIIVSIIDEKDERKSAGGIILSAAKEVYTQKCSIVAVGDTKGRYTLGSIAYIPVDIGIDIGFGELAVLEGDIIYCIEDELEE